MAYGHLQSKANADNAGGTTIAITWDGDTTADSLVTLFVAWAGNVRTISSVADSQTNTYEQIGSTVYYAADDQSVAAYQAVDITPGTTPTVTVTFDAAADFRAMVISEWSGIATSTPLDQHDLNDTGSGTTATSGSVTTTTDGQLIVGWVYIFDKAVAAADGGQERASNEVGGEVSVGVQDKRQTSQGAITTTWTVGSGAWLAAIATFKEAGGGGGGGAAPTLRIVQSSLRW